MRQKYNSRTQQPDSCDCSIIEDNGTITGYAAVFNKWSNLLTANVNGKNVLFREMILPGALDGLIDKCDVIANFNHEETGGILARSCNGIGTLKLIIDQVGLKYSFQVPDTSLGEDLAESMRRGDINASSFAFIVDPKRERWEKKADGTFERSISKLRAILDVAIVTRPAYPSATATARTGATGTGTATDAELENYYNDLKSQYAN